MKAFDHFVAELELPDGELHEVEGGWVGFPKGWENWDTLRKEFWLIRYVASWPRLQKIVKLHRFSIRG